jgi:hypothetical protein
LDKIFTLAHRDQAYEVSSDDFRKEILMPFHTWLRPHPRDCITTLKTKQRVVEKLKDLRVAFEAHIKDANLSEGLMPPSDSSRFVRIATWNIREFDSASYGYRTQEARSYIAEILSYFDLIALQEIRRDLDALNDIKRRLGPNWDYIATDVTEGASGNKERMAFLFNSNKVWFRNVAGELTLPKGQKVSDPFGERFKIEGGAKLELPAGQALVSPKGLKTTMLASGKTKLRKDVEIPLPEGSKVYLPSGSTIRFKKKSHVPINADGGIEIEATPTPTLPETAEIVLPPNSLLGDPHQFARTPFIASFQAGWLKINLATLHIYYGEGDPGMQRRKEEIQRLTAILSKRAKSDKDSDADSYFIALGDFNIVSPEHETMHALESNGFMIPEPLKRIPGSNVKKDKFYDQIAIWEGNSKRRMTYTHIIPYRAGVFDFFDVVYRKDEVNTYQSFMQKPGSDEKYSNYLTWRTYQMSDHLPQWVELHIDFSQDYLSELEVEIQTKIDN